MSAIDFIKHLQTSQLISDKIAGKLREQVEGAPKKVSANSVSRLLIKKKLLSKSQVESALKSYESKPQRSDDDELELLSDEPETKPLEIVEPITDLAVLADEAPATVDIDTSPRVGEIHEPMNAGFDHDSDHEEETTEAESYDVTTSTKGRQRRKKYTSNRWDSPLMLAGGGTLLFLGLLGAVLYFYLTKGTADEAFKMADDDYRAESYSQAVAKFEKFVNDYPDDEKSSLARVRIVSAKIWNSVNLNAWDSALEQVQRELPTVLAEESFDVIRAELASILPSIMEGFAAKASETQDMKEAQAKLGLADDAFKEINNSAYLPTRFRKQIQPKLDTILDVVKKVERDINRDKELAVRIQEMTAAMDAGNTAQAYGIRHNLLRQYPELINNDQLRASVLEITKRERDSIASASELPAAIADDHAKTADFEVTLASNTGSTADSLQGQTVFVVARGSIYALEAANGKVKWRRFVGFESTTDPVLTGPAANRDAIVVDSRRHELLRLSGADGNLMWRIPCPGPIATPFLQDDQLLVSCKKPPNGLLLKVDVASGTVSAGVSFPSELSSSALVVDGTIYQPGAHSTLFVLNAESLACKDVVYVGHGQNTIEVAPVSVANHIIVAENPGPNFSLLHVFAPDLENEERLRLVMDPIRLKGRVVSPLSPFGNRFLVTTDVGAVEVFEVDSRNAATPVKAAVRGIVPTVRSDSNSRSLFADGRFWLGNSQLTRYDLLTSRGVFSQKWIRNQGDDFVGPMQLIGDVLFHVRIPKGRLGATVAAISVSSDANDGKEIWQTEIGVPPAGPVFVNTSNKTVNVVTANGTLYSLTGTQLQSNSVDRPTAQITSRDVPALELALEINDSKRVFLPNASSSKYVLYDAGGSSTLNAIDMGIGRSHVAVPPVMFGEKLLVPTTEGTVYVLNPEDGKTAAHEFQPALTSGGEIHWIRPVVDKTSNEAYLSDGKKHLYRIGLEDSPTRLQSVAQSELELELHGQLAKIGNAIYAVERYGQIDKIVAINALDLTVSPKKWPLDGQIAWGPQVVGNHVLAASDSGELICLDAEQNERWKVKLNEGPLAGTPILADDAITLSSVAGTIWQIDAATGENRKRIVLGQPIGTGPQQFGNRFVVLGSDSTIYVLGFSN